MMDSERWQRVEQLFHSALEKPPSDRPAFLAEACEQDADLQRRVEVLLAQTGPTEALIDKRAWRAATELTYGRTILEPGLWLGPYQIVALLGHGGMGSVYRAIDTRLDRAVAIKVSAAQFSARFDREARAVSALNHPNICTLHDVGPNFLVMELVEGETLADRIERDGRLPVKEALDISLQVAEAVEAAHEKGVIHCDLKPSNIKITPDGRAKVLDFGLARAIRDDQAEGDDSAPTTRTGDGSATGQVLGTPAYMSPEQARGQHVDARTDVWSYGCVLYELLAGKRAFQGKTSSEIIDAIWEGEPHWQALPAGTPGTIRHLLRECLEKDAVRRLRDIRMARSAIETSMRGTRVVTSWLAVGLGVLLAVAGLTAWFLRERDVNLNQSLHAVPLTTYLGSQDWPSFSPDGTQVAFSWDGETQNNFDIYVKPVGSGPPVRLTRSMVNNANPAWSPDGRWIAFLSGTRPGRSSVVLIPPSGGPERVVAEVASPGPSVQSLAWSPDSKYLVVFDHPAGQAGGLWLLSVDNRELRRLTSVVEGSAPLDRAPAFATDGSSLAFVRRVANNSEDLYLLPLGAGVRPVGQPRQITRLNQATPSLAWATDQRGLIFSSGPPGNQNLWRVPIIGAPSVRRLTEQGDVLNLSTSPRSHRLVFAQSRREMDIYRADLSGKAGEARRSVPLIASSRLDRYPRYSPDGKKIAFVSLRSGNWQLWICGSDGTNAVQMTSFDRGEVAFPNWSPDGQQIGFTSNAEGSYQAYVVNASGGQPRKREDLGTDVSGWTWSRDGRWIVFFCHGEGEASQLCRIPAQGNHREQITRMGATGWIIAESAQNPLLYFIRQGGVWSVPIEGGQEQQVLKFDVDPGWLEAAQSGIYFISHSTPTRDGDLMFYPFPNGPVEKVTGIQARYGFSISPDGRYLIYTRMTSAGSDLMLIDKFY